VDLDEAARRLGGPVLIAAGTPIGVWEQAAENNDLLYVQVETDERDDPLVVHTRRGPLHAITALSIVDNHVNKCQVQDFWPGIVFPDSLHPTEIVVNGEPTPGYLLDGGTVSEIVLRVGQLSVAVVATATWLGRHGGWPELISGRGNLDDAERARITGQPR